MLHWTTATSSKLARHAFTAMCLFCFAFSRPPESASSPSTASRCSLQGLKVNLVRPKRSQTQTTPSQTQTTPMPGVRQIHQRHPARRSGAVPEDPSVVLAVHASHRACLLGALAKIWLVRGSRALRGVNIAQSWRVIDEQSKGMHAFFSEKSTESTNKVKKHVYRNYHRLPRVVSFSPSMSVSQAGCKYLVFSLW